MGQMEKAKQALANYHSARVINESNMRSLTNQCRLLRAMQTNTLHYSDLSASTYGLTPASYMRRYANRDEPQFSDYSKQNVLPTEVVTTVMTIFGNRLREYKVRVDITPGELMHSLPPDVVNDLSASIPPLRQIVNSTLVDNKENYAVVQSAINRALLLPSALVLVELATNKMKRELYSRRITFSLLETEYCLFDYTASSWETMAYLGVTKRVMYSTIQSLYPDSAYVKRNEHRLPNTPLTLVMFFDATLGIEVHTLAEAQSEILFTREMQFKNADGEYLIPVARLTYEQSAICPVVGASPISSRLTSLISVSELEHRRNLAISQYKALSVIGLENAFALNAAAEPSDVESTVSYADSVAAKIQSATHGQTIVASTKINTDIISPLGEITRLTAEVDTAYNRLFSSIGVADNEISAVTRATATEIENIKQYQNNTSATLQKCIDAFITQLASIALAGLRVHYHPEELDENNLKESVGYHVNGVHRVFTHSIFAAGCYATSFKEEPTFEARMQNAALRSDVIAKIIPVLASYQKMTPDERSLFRPTFNDMMKDVGASDFESFASDYEKEEEKKKAAAPVEQSSTQPEEVAPISPEAEPSIPPEDIPADVQLPPEMA